VLWSKEGVELTLLGGQVRQGSPDLVGPATEILLENLTADVAMLGSDGIDPERGSFAGDLATARVAKQMARSAKSRIVLTDSDKLGRPGAARYLAIPDIDELITDRNADPKVLRRLRSRGVRVTVV
jgi:DeoR/GlpR family transcriptional regulator of sugar metabolism